MNGEYYGLESYGVGTSVAYAWYYGDSTLYIEKIDSRNKKLSVKMVKLINKACNNRARFNWVIADIMEEENIKMTGVCMLHGPVILGRILKLYGKDTIEINKSDLVKDIKSGRLAVWGYKREKEKAKLGYILGVERPSYNKDYVHINVNLKSSITKEEVLKWYRENKKDIFKILEDKYNPKRNKGIPINFYEVGSVTLLTGNTLRFTLQIRTELYNILQGNNKESD